MTENQRFGVITNDENFLLITNNERKLSQLQVCALLNDFNNENEKLKYENEILSEELEQCKAVIDKTWSEYLRKKELQE